MAIAVELLFKGTLDQYDRVVKKMGFTPRGNGAPHALFHWVAKTQDGFVVVDVWDSKAEFDKFAQTRIGPLSAEEGLAPPIVKVHEVHNYLFGG
jgi:hypothetical protein